MSIYAGTKAFDDAFSYALSAELKQYNGSLYDPQTLYHSNHAPKADLRAWKDELSDAEQAVARSILGPWLEPYRIHPEDE